MAYYIPIMLDCEGLKVVLVGGGRIAARKAVPLLEGGAVLTVISPDLSPGLLQKQQTGELTWISRNYEPGDIAESGAGLVYACTPDGPVNMSVAAEARALNIPVNVADRSAEGNFITPAVIRRGDLVLSVSASGSGPLLARSIAEDLDRRYGEEYETYLRFCRTVRERIKEQVADPEIRVVLLNRLAELDILKQIRTGRFHFWTDRQIDEWIVKG